MIICPFCFTRNEENALYCAECGKELNLPDCAKHEFTHGVMRYVPDAKNEADETPLYLTREAAEAIRRDAPADASTGPATGKAAVPAAPAAPAAQGIPAPVSIPPAVSVPAGTAPAAKRARKKNSHLPAIIIMSVIGILVILIIFGIVILLGG